MAKRLCSDTALYVIDSFQIYKSDYLSKINRNSDRYSFHIPFFQLDAYIQNDYSLYIQYFGGSYVIPLERKLPQFGGVYYFFHCPCCRKRVRKLYCISGIYQCRTCGNLGYHSQLLRPWQRRLRNTIQIEQQLEKLGGSLCKKPPSQEKTTFNRLVNRCYDYEMQYIADVTYGHI